METNRYGYHKKRREYRSNTSTATIIHADLPVKHIGKTPEKTPVQPCSWARPTSCFRKSRWALKYVLGLFIDIKGAFDNLLWPALFKKLWSLNCPTNAGTGTRLCPVVESKDAWNYQGPVCGPLFWDIMIEKLLQLLDDATRRTQTHLRVCGQRRDSARNIPCGALK